MTIGDLDYCLTRDGVIYLVKGYYHLADSIIAYPVFWPDPNGDRYHPILGRYLKDVSDFNERLFRIYRSGETPRQTPRLPRSQIIHVWQPKPKMSQFLIKETTGLWRGLVDYLVQSVGIPQDNLGIFGSYLVDMHRNLAGQQIKDIDFVIYGISNLLKVKTALPELMRHFGYGPISADHLNYHIQKFGNDFKPSVNSFKLTLSNKWSSIQIKPGLLCTLRFSYLDSEIPPDPIQAPILHAIQIQGQVTDDIGANFMPRVFKIDSSDREYTVVTYFWGFQSCVRRGDYVIITGNLHRDGRTISIDERSHGIKIIAPATRNSSKYYVHCRSYLNVGSRAGDSLVTT